MKIAILHEMLIKFGWAEKVALCLKSIFPEADFFTLIYDEKKIGNNFPKNSIHPSCKKLYSQRIYNITKKQRLCLPFMSWSVESLDFSSYDYVLVSSSGFAHGLKKWNNTKTIVYYHAPARYMWDWTHEYREEIWFHKWFRWFLYGKLMKKMRIWDFDAAQKNNTILANSSTTAKRIWKYYRKKSEIIFPPIETQRFSKKISQTDKDIILSKISIQIPGSSSSNTQALWTDFWNILSQGNYYIILSALTEFKRLDIAILNFKKLPEQNLCIIGKWEYGEQLQKLAEGSKNIFFLWAQYDDSLVALVQNSMGLIFPGEEDFGIVPIEMMAAWKPVFALEKGWLTETVIKWKTWDFFTDPEWRDFCDNFKSFHKNNSTWFYSPKACKEQAYRYDTVFFEEKIREHIRK